MQRPPAGKPVRPRAAPMPRIRDGRAIIIGAGPAGLTAAFELLLRTGVRPLVLEQDGVVGGLARTVEHAGNRIDLGGHRFFSKSDRVMRWWLDVLPLQALDGERHLLGYHRQTRELVGDKEGPDPEHEDRVMLLRPRRSRILHGRRLFDYPLGLTPDTVAKLGVARTLRIGASYAWRLIRPRRPEVTLEDFFINRFGDELYRTFFRSYTEKVWGRACSELSAEWGAQRVKGLSISRAITHRLRALTRRRAGDLAQRTTETSLIERFLYPKLGPGQMWQAVAASVTDRGGEVRLRHRVVGIEREGARVVAVRVEDIDRGRTERVPADYVLSTMPVRDLVRAFGAGVPAEVGEVAEGLVYRDFITVGLLLRRLRLPDPGPALDNWIYVQEPDVKVGRLQIFNNWSPWMVRDPATTWVGLEYFCTVGDALWRLADDTLADFATGELARLGLAARADVLDAVVVRVEKAYPAYLETYDRFPVFRAWVDRFENLFLLGRNGMHRYNNQDHSMLTAMTAVDNIAAGVTDKANVWAVNTEADYHEERA